MLNNVESKSSTFVRYLSHWFYSVFTNYYYKIIYILKRLKGVGVCTLWIGKEVEEEGSAFKLFNPSENQRISSMIIVGCCVEKPVHLFSTVSTLGGIVKFIVRTEDKPQNDNQGVG